MGASSSVLVQNGSVFHIHISLSTKHLDNNHIIQDVVAKLRQIGFQVTTTDSISSTSTKEICETLRASDVVIYCSTQAYGSCVSQAIEYSYLSENDKIVYNVFMDDYENRTFADHMQRLFEGDCWELSSVDDISAIVKDINQKVLMC